LYRVVRHALEGAEAVVTVKSRRGLLG
jgi:hypothetical protein